MRLVESTWPEIPERSILVVPLGSCEQHGPHLSLDTDTRIAEHLSAALVDPGATGEQATVPQEGATARPVGPLVLGPTITLGASGEHEDFPGTLSIGTVALEAVLVELVRSALPEPGSRRPAPFAGVVIVNGHGGNVEATGRAAALVGAEGRDVLVWHPRVPDGDSHAGRTETSLLMHLDPGCVRVDRLEVGSTARWREIGEAVMSGGLAAVTPNGVLGDPTVATSDEGAVLFDRLVGDLRAAVDAWRDTLER